MKLTAAGISWVFLSVSVLVQGFYFDPSPEGRWAYQSHKGSFSYDLNPNGECFVVTSVEPDGGAQIVPCTWRIEGGGYVVVRRAAFQVKDGRQTDQRIELPFGSVMLHYDPRHDSMEMLGGREAWLRRDLGLGRLIR
jgi:hypothetical protein